jgi:hypothetical protein
MDTTSESKPIELHHTGVPVDRRDPNHPHFPGDIETRAFKRSCMTKGARRITALVLLAIASIITALIVGGTLGMGRAKKPAPAIATSTASAEVETVYTTTNVFSTSVVTHFITSNPTTIATTTTPSVPTPTSTSEPPEEESPKPSKTPMDEPSPGSGGRCYIAGNFGTNAECEKTCQDLVRGRKAYCEVDMNAVYKCVICKA